MIYEMGKEGLKSSKYLSTHNDREAPHLILGLQAQKEEICYVYYPLSFIIL